MNKLEKLIFESYVSREILNWDEKNKANIGDYAYQNSQQKLIQKLIRLPISKIITEPTNKLYPDVIKKYISGYENHPVVYQDQGDMKYYLDDGHHRLLSQKHKGEKYILVWLRRGMKNRQSYPKLDLPEYWDI